MRDGVISKVELLDYLDRKQYMFIGLHEYKMLKKEIQSGTFDLLPTDVDEDVKEIEEALNGYHEEFSAHPYATPEERRVMFTTIELNATKWLRQLLTKYTETLAQVEEVRQLYKESMNEQAREYLEVGKKLDQAVELLETVNRIFPVSVPGIDNILQSIKGETPHDHT